MHYKTKRIICIVTIILTVLWIVFIFGNSMKTGEESGEQSSEIQQIIEEVIEDIGVDVTVDGGDVRNAAHFIEFFVLGILVCADVLLISAPSVTEHMGDRMLIAFEGLLFCVSCAVIDELIQGSFEGRVSDINDVLLDSVGAACGTVLVFLVFLFVLKAKKRKNNVSV